MFSILMLLGYVDARVFCEDANAMGWAPTGYSCPVLCASVRDAVDRYPNDGTVIRKPGSDDGIQEKSRLIMLDYKKSIQEQFGQNENGRFLKEQYFDETILTQNQVLRKNSILDENIKKQNEKSFKNNREDIDVHANEIFKSLQNSEDILRPYKILDKNVSQSGQGYDGGKKKCWYLEKFKKKLLLGKVVRRECSRRSNFDGKFLSIMTNVLNEYADTMFKFTEEMTEILLDNIFGQNTDLRNNIFDVNKLLKYLRKSVDLHKSHSHVITLTSRRCLTISVPGCYCKRGFVESSGQCVRPSDCIEDNYYVKYLKRIIIT